MKNDILSVLDQSVGLLVNTSNGTIYFERKILCRNRNWSFEGPTEVDSVKTLLLSECVAQGFLPPLIRKELRETVDSIFMSYGTDVPDETRLADFQVFTPEFSPQVDSEIFRQAYQAWENSSYLKISYCSIKGHDSEKLIVGHGAIAGIFSKRVV